MTKNKMHQFRSRPRKSVALFLAGFCVDYLASDLSLKQYGRKVKSVMWALDQESLYGLVNSKKDYQEFGNYFFKKFIRDKKYLSDLIAWSEKRKNILKNYLEKNLSSSIISRLSNKDIESKFNGYINLYRNFHLINTPSWWVGADVVESVLRQELKKYENKQDELFNQLVSLAEYRTENFLAEISLLNIARLLQKKGLKKIKSINYLDPKIKKIINHHVEEFYSIPFGYNTGIVWDEKYVIKQINQLLKNDDNLSLAYKNKLDQDNDELALRNKLIDDLKLSKKTNSLAKILRQLAYLQEIKKTVQTKSHPLMQLVVYPEIAKRLKVPVKYLNFLSPDEIASSLNIGRLDKSFSKQIKKRMGLSVLIMKDLKYFWLYDDEAKKFFIDNELLVQIDNIKEIKGVVASAGLVVGKVVVCRYSTEIKKVNKGDILVTAMTTPDFVPAMKKAGAIITDEGGITSHAAIISRELNKPCIIGTKIATKVLKDGDLVEVDANKGVVKKID